MLMGLSLSLKLKLVSGDINFVKEIITFSDDERETQLSAHDEEPVDTRLITQGSLPQKSLGPEYLSPETLDECIADQGISKWRAFAGGKPTKKSICSKFDLEEKPLACRVCHAPRPRVSAKCELKLLLTSRIKFYKNELLTIQSAWHKGCRSVCSKSMPHCRFPVLHDKDFEALLHEHKCAWDMSKATVISSIRSAKAASKTKRKREMQQHNERVSVKLLPVAELCEKLGVAIGMYCSTFNPGKNLLIQAQIRQ